MTAPGYPDFNGAKAAFFHEGRLLTCLRDDFAHIPWPGFHDLPGGGREGDEAPAACLLRELREEFGLILPPDRLEYEISLPSMQPGEAPGWFFAGRLSRCEIEAIRFGDEGQSWQMMEVASFLSHPLAIPALQQRVRLVLAHYPCGC